MKQRQKIVPLARGLVQEIGIGSGLNIPFYDAERVSHLWVLDPSREMWAIAERNAAEHRLETEFIEAGAEHIPLEDDSADTVGRHLHAVHRFRCSLGAERGKAHTETRWQPFILRTRPGA